MKILNITIPFEIINSLIAIVIAVLVYLVIKGLVNKLAKIGIVKKTKYDQRRIKTALMLIKRIVKYIIIIITIVIILSIFHINTTALITSLSALSVVFGLIFQDLLKDIIVGITNILEDNYSIGDYIEINGFKGEVLDFNLKSTRLKSLTNEVRIISNREITELTNYSLNKSNVLININVSYEEDILKVEKVLKELCENIPKITDKVSEVVLADGIEELGDSSVVFRLSTLVNIKDIYFIKRIILKEVKMAFDKNNISIPYPQLEVHNER